MCSNWWCVSVGSRSVPTRSCSTFACCCPMDRTWRRCCVVRDSPRPSCRCRCLRRHLLLLLLAVWLVMAVMHWLRQLQTCHHLASWVQSAHCLQSLASVCLQNDWYGVAIIILLYYVHKLDVQRRDSTFAPTPQTYTTAAFMEGRVRKGANLLWLRCQATAESASQLWAVNCGSRARGYHSQITV